MKRMAIAAAALAAATAWAQPGGYGPGQGMGPGGGMMAPGYGMGPGMMGGGMGPGMMGGMGAGMIFGQGLDLTDEQRARLYRIHEETAAKRWALMEQMHEASLEARKRMEAVLTDEQRQKLEQRWRRR